MTDPETSDSGHDELLRRLAAEDPEWAEALDTAASDDEITDRFVARCQTDDNFRQRVNELAAAAAGPGHGHMRLRGGSDREPSAPNPTRRAHVLVAEAYQRLVAEEPFSERWWAVIEADLDQLLEPVAYAQVADLAVNGQEQWQLPAFALGQIRERGVTAFRTEWEAGQSLAAACTRVRNDRSAVALLANEIEIALPLVEAGARWLLDDIIAVLDLLRPAQADLVERSLSIQYGIPTELELLAILKRNGSTWQEIYSELAEHPELLSVNASRFFKSLGEALDREDLGHLAMLVERGHQVGVTQMIDEHKSLRLGLYFATGASDATRQDLLDFAFHMHTRGVNNGSIIQLDAATVVLESMITVEADHEAIFKLALVLNDRSNLLLLDGKTAAAKAQLDRAILLLENSTLASQASTEALALLLLSRGDPADVTRAIDLFPDLDEENPSMVYLVACSLAKRAELRVGQDQDELALGDLSRAIALFESGRDSGGHLIWQGELVDCLAHHADILARLGQIEQSMMRLDRGISLLEGELLDRELAKRLARLYHRRATLMYRDHAFGSEVQALSDCSRGIDILSDMVPRHPELLSELANLLSIRGLLFKRARKLESAQQDLGWEVSIRNALGADTSDLAGALLNLSAVKNRRGMIADALVDCSEAISILQRLSLRGDEYLRKLARSLYSRSGLYVALEEEPAALLDCTNSIAVLGSVRDPKSEDLLELASAFSNRGAVYFRAGEYLLASADYTSALEILVGQLERSPSSSTKILICKLLQNRSALLRESGDLSRAVEDASEALEFLLRLGEEGLDIDEIHADLLINRGTARGQLGILEDAESDLIRGIEILESLLIENQSYVEDIALAINNLGNVQRASGELDKALKSRMRAVEIIRDKGSRSLAPPDWLSGGLGLLEREFVADQRYGDALELLEASRTLGLDERIRRQEALGQRLQTVDPELAEKLAMTVNQLEVARQTGQAVVAATADRRRRELEEQVRGLGEEFARFGQPLRADYLQSLVPEGAAVVHLVAAESGGFALITTTTSTTGLLIDITMQQAAALDTIVRRLNQAKDGADDAKSRHVPMSESVMRLVVVASALIGPVAEALPEGLEDLVLVPCGYLAALPWHAATLPDGEPLIDRWPVRYLASLTSLAIPLPAASGTGAVIVQPHGRSSPGPLPFTDFEATIVRALLGGARRYGERSDPDDVLRGTAAAASVHIASHFDARGISLCGEYLSPSDLERQPILDRTEAYLSACGTRDFAPRHPDEQVGLIRALIATGYRRVLATPWPIDDDAGAVLAILYHHHRRQHPEMPAAASLAQVQRQMRSTATELAALLAEVRTSLEESSGSAHQRANELLKALAPRFAGHDRPYAHPVHWAALTLTGS